MAQTFTYPFHFAVAGVVPLSWPGPQTDSMTVCYNVSPSVSDREHLSLAACQILHVTRIPSQQWLWQICKTDQQRKRTEPPHDKTNKLTVHRAKTQISLGIRPVWSETSLCAQWVAKDPSFLYADSKDWSDWADAQADPSLRWAHMPFCWCHETAQMYEPCGSDVCALSRENLSLVVSKQVRLKLAWQATEIN